MELPFIQNKIYEIRGQRVMLDFDLAEKYGTETKYLKRSVKNNIRRFTSDFMFEQTKEKFELINETLAELQVRNKTLSETRAKIGFVKR